jgi:hypothetical protein
MNEQEEALYDLCTELHRSWSVRDATYERAVKALGGEDKVVEAVTLEGYYALLAMVMNTAGTPIPEGRTPPLPSSRAEFRAVVERTSRVGRGHGQGAARAVPQRTPAHFSGAIAAASHADWVGNWRGRSVRRRPMNTPQRRLTCTV